MADDWRHTTLGEVLTLQRGFDLPETERTAGPYPVIASTGPVGTHTTAIVKGPGVVIGRSGSLGGGQFIPSDFWPLNTTLWVKDFKGNDTRFCYYLLKSLDLAHFNAGSGVPTLNRNHIHPLQVRLPPDLREQRTIGAMLGALDDKIELTRRMNGTLEAIARAIFKSWFVDFDPVRARMEGREDLGLDADVAALFPDSFQDSPVGTIPAGWSVTTLGEMATLQRGFDLPAAERAHGSVPVVASTGIVGMHDETRVSGPGVVIGRSGSIGQPQFIPTDFWPLNTTLWVGDFHRNDPHYVYYLLKQMDFSRFNSGTGVPTLNRNHVHPLPVLMPPPELRSRFGEVVKPMFAALRCHQEESRTLASIRDALLPKLISGEIHIKNAEKAVETGAESLVMSK
jgi:type I restriction enzyme S subunit